MSSNLITDLAQVNLIKQNIKNAIINKGMIVTDFNSYSGAIENIETGGGAYQYSNLESMYNSASNRYNGDIGVIYSDSQENITETTEFQKVIFPDTVVLDSAITSSIRLDFVPINPEAECSCIGNLKSTELNLICFTGGDGINVSINVRYTSQDGITYIKVSGENEQDFGTLVKWNNSYSWNNAIGKFIKVKFDILGGIYQHNGINFNPINTGLNAIQDQVWGNSFYGKNSILNGTLNKTTNLNLQQLKDRVNLYANISSLSFDSSVTSLSYLFVHDSSIVNVPNYNTANITNMDCIFTQCYNLISVPIFNTINVVNMEQAFRSCNNLSNESIQNIISMCINSNIPSGKRNISNVNSYSPLFSTKFDNSYYSDRLSDLTNAGWSY